MKKLNLFIISVFMVTLGFSQNYNPDRYLYPIYPTTLVTNDIQYGTAPQWVWPYWDEDLFLNVTVPNGDANPKRPLLIFAHAGGFINGSKDVDDMVAICDSFAKMGFVTATIDYRKGFDPLDGESAERAVYRGIQDGKTAIRYFKTNASLYDIDTNYVFFGGMSAGGFIALHVGFMDKESERPLSTYGGGTVNDLGCLDCGDNPGVSSSVRGVLDYWGAVQDTTIIESNSAPTLIIHGENDPTVPFVYGAPFGVTTIPDVYGAQPVKERCDNMGVYTEFYTSQGQLHMLDSSDNGTWNPAPGAFWGDTLLPRTRDFIYKLIKPNTDYVSPQAITVCIGDTSIFEVTDGINSHYVWDFNSDPNIDEVENLNQKTIKLGFNAAGTYALKVVEFNEILCAGDTLEFNITVEDLPIASFTSSVINAFDASFTNTSIGGSTYFWDFGDGSTSTDQNPTHVYTQEGDFTVTLVTTSVNGCESIESSEIINITTAGIEEIETVILVNNPFENELYINSETMLQDISIYSVDGKLMYSNVNPSNQITLNTQDWKSGLYILMFTNENGTLSQQKLIKI